MPDPMLETEEAPLGGWSPVGYEGLRADDLKTLLHLGLNFQKQKNESRAAAIRYQGQMDFQRLVSQGMPHNEALLQAAPKMFFQDPSGYATFSQHQEAAEAAERRAAAQAAYQQQTLAETKRYHDLMTTPGTFTPTEPIEVKDAQGAVTGKLVNTGPKRWQFLDERARVSYEIGQKPDGTFFPIPKFSGGQAAAEEAQKYADAMNAEAKKHTDMMNAEAQKKSSEPSWFGKMISGSSTYPTPMGAAMPSVTATETSAPAPVVAAPVPVPPTQKPLDKNTAIEFLRQAKGDKEKARQMARDAGYTF